MKCHTWDTVLSCACICCIAFSGANLLSYIYIFVGCILRCSTFTKINQVADAAKINQQFFNDLCNFQGFNFGPPEKVQKEGGPRVPFSVGSVKSISYSVSLAMCCISS